MKKYALLALIFIGTLTSCSIDDDSSNAFSLEVLPIDSVDIPEEFILGETYEIGITYSRPNTCYQFNDFIYDINANERTVAVVNTVYTGSNCNSASNQDDVSEEDVTVHFNFIVTSTDTYLFKFYQGENNEGEDQFILVEVPVVED